MIRLLPASSLAKVRLNTSTIPKPPPTAPHQVRALCTEMPIIRIVVRLVYKPNELNMWNLKKWVYHKFPICIILWISKTNWNVYTSIN